MVKIRCGWYRKEREGDRKIERERERERDRNQILVTMAAETLKYLAGLGPIGHHLLSHLLSAWCVARGSFLLKGQVQTLALIELAASRLFLSTNDHDSDFSMLACQWFPLSVARSWPSTFMSRRMKLLVKPVSITPAWRVSCLAWRAIQAMAFHTCAPDASAGALHLACIILDSAAQLDQTCAVASGQHCVACAPFTAHVALEAIGGVFWGQ